MTQESPAPPPERIAQDAPTAPDAAGLEALVGDWLPIPDLAQALDVELRTARRMIEERQLLAHRVGERSVLAVPAAFVHEGRPVAHLEGTFTVLADAGLSDTEALLWLFTPDPTLPLPGAPIDMLRAGRRAEVRKRAQELAF